MANFIIEDLKRVFSSGSSLARLIVANVLVFVPYNLIVSISRANNGGQITFLEEWLTLSANLPDNLLKPWSIIAYNFLHFDFGHILGNMLIFYIFGRIYQDFQGSKKLTGVYFLGGIAGGIFFLLLYNIAFLINPDSTFFHQRTILLGASASVTAVMVAAATLAPNHEVKLILLPPFQIKYIALFILVLSSVLDITSNTGGKFAHLGGAAWGYFYVYQMQNGKDYGKWFHNLLDNLTNLFKPKSKLKVTHRSKDIGKRPPQSNQKTPVSDRDRQQHVDRILDKISKSGYDSLTKEEKDFLFRMSNKEGS